MMKARTSLWASLAIAASLGLAGCGGSSDDKDDDMMAGADAPVPTAVPLPSGHGLAAGTTDLASGPTTVGGTTLTCTPAEGSTGCSLTVTEDDVLGTHTAAATGGTVSVTVEPAPAAMVSLALPEGNTIRAKLTSTRTGDADTEISESITVDAGETEDYSGVRFSCPSGGPNCTVKFTLDANEAMATTGGEGNGEATAALLSTAAIGTGVGFGTLHAEVRVEPDAAAGRPAAGARSGFGKLADRLGFPHSDERLNADGDLVTAANSGTVADRQLKGPVGQDFAEVTHAAAEAPSAWTGWMGKAWTGGDETLVRFDNQGTGMSFAAKYGNKSGSSNDVTPTATTDAGPAFWDFARTTPAAGQSGPVSVSTNTDGTAQYSIPATFDGVAGTLSCSAGCGNLVNDGGDLRGVSGTNNGNPTGANWKFTATDANAAVGGIKADYLAFGWWREAGTGDTIADFEPVYGGRVPFSDTAIAAADGTGGLAGKATYEGGAAGNYTMGSANSPDRHGGWFVADAKITATFDNPSAAGVAADRDTIKGEISNFRGAHEGLLDGWKLESTLKGDLDAGTFSSVRTVVGPVATDYSNASVTQPGFEIPASSGSTSHATALAATTVNLSGTAAGKSWAGGAWGGTFYGNPSASNTLPSGVAGWFHANTAVGSEAVAIQGSFAATR